ncbi:hypothetical protein LO762_11865 [Actinocorallia sp. API 0066]|uniref:hypothetical protein n=1 Tax=Actinocorallia sp. API 0066 TaxID=2896846 RepID=UPI001E3404AA|nr:hypothetical protein [Actinocorallia sp. API 0066]MCD0449879.1 hypothetical protein [Actinocorallia sp. API 0066]
MAVLAGLAAPGTAAVAAEGDADKGNWVYTDRWGVIGRNTLGSPTADLRFGPWGRTSPTQNAARQDPPYGRGSLGIIVAGPQVPGDVLTAEKVAFGNEKEYAGVRLSSIRTLQYSIFTGMDTTGAALPGISFEIDPNLTTGVDYSTIGYLPQDSTSPSAPDTPALNVWQRYDAAADGSAWFATGPTGPAINCEPTDPCTFAELKAALPNAVITYSVQFQKGRDNAFVGAVDGLRINDTIYDFEFNGVRKRRA